MQTVEELQAHYKAVKARLAAKPYRQPIIEKQKIVNFAGPAPITNGERILIETAAKHKISIKDLRSSAKYSKIVNARWECMYRLKVELNLPLTAIARFMNRDHTSVLHALRKYEKTRQQVAGQVDVSDA